MSKPRSGLHLVLFLRADPDLRPAAARSKSRQCDRAPAGVPGAAGSIDVARAAREGDAGGDLGERLPLPAATSTPVWRWPTPSTSANCGSCSTAEPSATSTNATPSRRCSHSILRILPATRRPPRPAALAKRNSTPISAWRSWRTSMPSISANLCGNTFDAWLERLTGRRSRSDLPGPAASTVPLNRPS